MEELVLTFGMVAVVVVDADSKFKHKFEEILSALRIKLWALVQGNHKVLSVERYHRLLNKTQTTSDQDRGTHASVFLKILRNRNMHG